MNFQWKPDNLVSHYAKHVTNIEEYSDEWCAWNDAYPNVFYHINNYKNTSINIINNASKGYVFYSVKYDNYSANFVGKRRITTAVVLHNDSSTPQGSIASCYHKDNYYFDSWILKVMESIYKGEYEFENNRFIINFQGHLFDTDFSFAVNQAITRVGRKFKDDDNSKARLILCIVYFYLKMQYNKRHKYLGPILNELKKHFDVDKPPFECSSNYNVLYARAKKQALIATDDYFVVDLIFILKTLNNGDWSKQDYSAKSDIIRLFFNLLRRLG